MSKFTSPLEGLKVAAPCRADWDEMIGEERVRFCQQCERNVYNLSGMSRAEAERLVTNAEGRLCVRFYRRLDGTVLTANCPVGLRALKQRAARTARAFISAVLGFFAGLGVSPGPPGRWIPIVGADALPQPGAAPKTTQPTAPVTGKLVPVNQVVPVTGEMVMGAPLVSVEDAERSSRRKGRRVRRK